MCCNQDRLSDQKCRLNRHLRSNNRQLLASNMGQLSRTQTRRCHRLQLRRSDACAPPHLASLGLLDLPGGEGHVGVAPPLLVQLLLRPQQPLQHHRQLALCALCMLRSQDSCIEFARNLKLVCKSGFRSLQIHIFVLTISYFHIHFHIDHFIFSHSVSNRQFHL